MGMIEHMQYELKAANTSLLKLEKELQERDVVISDLKRKNLLLQERVDRLHQAMQTRSYIEELLSRFKDEEEAHADG
jgi:peptidoglycan hydrolase CwlO-like protein